jgi:hypothetical protein
MQLVQARSFLRAGVPKRVLELALSRMWILQEGALVPSIAYKTYFEHTVPEAQLKIKEVFGELKEIQHPDRQSEFEWEKNVQEVFIRPRVVGTS